MKIFVKITRILPSSLLIETVEAFESENHFLLLSSTDKTIDSSRVLTGAEVDLHVSTLQSAVIAADRKKAQAKALLDEVKHANKALFDLMGAGYFFQDEEGVVYKTDVCDGKFVYFDPVEIKRTRRDGEAKGSLSMTEARNAGFEVEGK